MNKVIVDDIPLKVVQEHARLVDAVQRAGRDLQFALATYSSEAWDVTLDKLHQATGREQVFRAHMLPSLRTRIVDAMKRYASMFAENPTEIHIKNRVEREFLKLDLGLKLTEEVFTTGAKNLTKILGLTTHWNAEVDFIEIR